MLEEQVKEVVLRCPLCTLSTVRLPLINEAGVDFISDPQRLQILRGGKVFRISGTRKIPVVTDVSQEQLSPDKKIIVLPNFGFDQGNLVWISATAVHNYEDYRILKELPGRIAKMRA